MQLSFQFLDDQKQLELDKIQIYFLWCCNKMLPITMSIGKKLCSMITLSWVSSGSIIIITV